MSSRQNSLPYNKLCAASLVPSVLLLSLLALLLPGFVRAEQATEAEMETVCVNWLTTIVQERGDWAGSKNPSIDVVSEIIIDGVLLGRSYSIAPRGHVVVPVLKEISPIKVSSDQTDLDINESDGVARLLREILKSRAETFIDVYGSLDAVQTSGGDQVFSSSHRALWDLYTTDPITFASSLRGEPRGERTQVGPLLTSTWHQSAPYNLDAPMGDGGQCVVGCVATAAAQVMKYYEWPPKGLDSYSYYWDGDQSCGGNAGGGWLSADYMDTYDWANMPDGCGACTPEQEAAVANLCYEVGVAFQMDYGRCGSGAYTSLVSDVFPSYFRYADTISEKLRSAYSTESWFGMVQEEVNAGRPMLYAFRYSQSEGHAIVCDGWRDTGGINQYHMNYGWGGAYNAWYSIDEIYHTFNPMEERLYPGIQPGTGFVFEVRADGLSYYPTIQSAVDDLLDGDIIELSDGVFTGDGNRDIDFHGKSLTVRSASGDPTACIIDCEGDPEAHRGFQFLSGEGSEAAIENITIRNGYMSGVEVGGALLCANGSTPTIRGCRLVENRAAGNGGAIACLDASPSILDCSIESNLATRGAGLHCDGSAPTVTGTVFAWNAASESGGAIALDGGSQPTLTNDTLHGNSAALGGGIWLSADSPVTLDRQIISFGTGGGAVACAGGSGATLTCCDLFGNSGGDWTDCVAGQDGQNGNISEDPLFCDGPAGDFHLQSESPCGAENNPTCEQIGALPLGCGHYFVNADGTGDFPTIQAAIDGAVDGDVIELANGIYTGTGNRDISYGGRSITIRSAGGVPDSCIIDCEGTPATPHRAFVFESGESHYSLLEGIMIRNGYQEVYSGAAIWCRNGSSPTIRNVTFCENTSGASGGAIYLSSESNATLEGCTFFNNSAGYGGGLLAYMSTVVIRGCTFAYNAATGNGGALCANSSLLTVENTIIAFSTDGAGVYCFGQGPTLSCSDVYGNAEGDWVGCIADQEGINGNISEDPLFCQPANGNFRLISGSPCEGSTPPNEECDLIGAWPADCDATSVNESETIRDSVALASAAPNPFALSTAISYRIPTRLGGAHVQVAVFDPSGRLVRVLVDDDNSAGTHQVVWNGTNEAGRAVAAGIYFARLRVAEERLTRRILLLR